MAEETKKSKYSKKQRMAALICIILIVLMNLVALVTSFIAAETGRFIFKISIACTIALPLFTWGYIWCYGRLVHKETIADVNLMKDLLPKEEENGR